MSDLQTQINDLQAITTQLVQQTKLLDGDVSVVRNLIKSVEQSLDLYRTYSTNEISQLQAEITALKAQINK